MSFDIGIHTVILLVGPSQSGKTTWAQHFKNKVIEQDPQLRTVILSSDEIRRQLLGHDYNRYDRKMMEASEAAFDLLFAQLKAAIRFPINNEFVIVDTTGLDGDFRRQVIDIAKENAYRVAVVAFDYPTSDYFTGLSGNDKTIISKHVETFKKQTLPNIKKKNFNFHFAVKAKSEKYFENLQVNILDYTLWNKSNLTTNNFDESLPVAIIGDIHEHVYALKALHVRLPENAQIILVGDILDKGKQTKEVIDYVAEMVANGAIMVRGNHEAFVARRLRGEIEEISNEDELFSSYCILKNDPLLAEKFLKLYDESLPFVCIKTHGKTVYVTHAPCYNKSLGKLDEKSQKFQRNFYFASRDNDSMVDELSFIFEQAKVSHPYHVFGHVAHSMKQVEIKNKVWLDTGAVYGGKLSAFIIYPHGDTKVVSQQADKLYDGKMLQLSKGKANKPKDTTVISITDEKVIASERLQERSTTMTPDKIALFENVQEISGNLPAKDDSIDYVNSLAQKHKLSPEDKYWLHSFNKSGAKFISGTMSPSRSTREELEPIKSAIQYFHTEGVEKVIIQPKYMGSRLQVYLHRDRTLDFAVTRSGTKAGNIKVLETVYDHWHNILDSQEFWEDCLVLDGELLPWSAIGKELIDKDFLQYGKSIQNELSTLNNDPVFSQFAEQIGLDAKAHKKEIDIFMEQLELYGNEHPVYYNPFSILSVDGKNYTKENQLNIFTHLLPKEPYMVLNLNDVNAVEQAESFFESLTTLSMTGDSKFAHEGVVIKPLVYKEGVAPYMKVRNEQYLHLIYGYDYKFDYQKMVDKKRIGKKLKLSIDEFEIGMKMLESKSQFELLDLACQMKFYINNEHELDPRL